MNEWAKGSHPSDRGVVDDLMTPEEVSSYLKIPKGTLSVWRSTNRVRLPFVRIGAAVRYRREDIDAFISRNLHAEVAA